MSTESRRRSQSQEFDDEAQYLLAAKLYELGKISAGKAAEMAGTTRLEFLRRLADYGIPAIKLDAEEAQSEMRAAREFAR